jgi:hypothetical protein
MTRGDDAAEIFSHPASDFAAKLERFSPGVDRPKSPHDAIRLRRLEALATFLRVSEKRRWVSVI